MYENGKGAKFNIELRRYVEIEKGAKVKINPCDIWGPTLGR